MSFVWFFLFPGRALMLQVSLGCFRADSQEA